MLKSISAVMAAAIVAAAVTALSAPKSEVTAGTVEEPTADAVLPCSERPWPYLNCVGTPYGNPEVRLVTTDRL